MTFTHLPAVLAEVDDLAQRFAAAGKRLFLVGGIVRDLWLGAELSAESDIDLTTDARPKEIKAIVADWADAVWTQGERFGTIGAERDGRAFEITTHRAEVYVPDSRKPEVAFGDDILADLERRDFTINAMAYEVPVGELIDPHDGVADLEASVLRTPLTPEMSFSDDPLRMIRAARFANKYSLIAAPELLAAATDLRARLDIVAIERIRAELDKLLSMEDVSTGLDLLHTTGLLDQMLPGAGAASVELANRVPGPWWLRVAAILTPMVQAGSNLDELVDSLRLSRQVAADINATVPSALALGAAAADVTDESVRRWVVGAKGRSSSAWTLGQALHGQTDTAAFGERWCALSASEDVTATDVPLSGQQICELLGIEPGPAVGAAVRQLQEHRLEHGPLTEDEAIAVLRAAPPA